MQGKRCRRVPQVPDAYEAGKLPDDFIEGMACEGGCVGGPSSFNDMLVTKKFRDELLQKQMIVRFLTI